MNASEDRSGPSASRVQAALLDYFKAPGNYQLTRRQPEVLFGSIREVLQIAAGRASSGTPGQDLQAAAAFFIRAALLYPGADHYTLLGLRSGTEPAELKERYRLLMRLIHPDFTQRTVGSWPADAAVRVNRAYEVLSSPVLRKEYDEQLASSRQASHATASKQEERRIPMPPRRTRSAGPPRIRIAKHTAWTFVGLIALVGVGMLLAPSEPVTLVQKSPRPAAGAKAGPQPRAPEPQSAPGVPSEAAVRDAAVPGRTSPAAQEEPEARAIVRGAAPPPSESPIRSLPQLPLAGPLLLQQKPVAPEGEHRPAAPAVPVAESMVPRARDLPASGLAQASLDRSMPGSAAPMPATISAASIRPAAVRAQPGPTLLDAQPLLTQLLHLIESGNGDQLLRLLDDDARQHSAAQALRRHYQKMVARGGHVRLSHVDFRGESRDDVLVVTGNLRMHVGETTIGSQGEALLLRAEFVSRGGKVVITGLSGGTE